MDLSAIERRLFSDVEGYSLSSIGRTRIERSADPSLTYGEITPAAVTHMLGRVQAVPGETFYDLGSGTGKAVIFAAMLGMGKAVGIELVPDLHDASQRVGDIFMEEVRPEHPAAGAVDFLFGDMFEKDVSDADVVFSHCTCFDDAMMARLAGKLESLKPGARVITVTKSLPSTQFSLSGSDFLPLAWGDATVYYHTRA